MHHLFVSCEPAAIDEAMAFSFGYRPAGKPEAGAVHLDSTGFIYSSAGTRPVYRSSTDTKCFMCEY